MNATDHKLIEEAKTLEVLSNSIVMPIESIVLQLVRGYKQTNKTINVSASDYLKDALTIQAATYKSILIMVVGSSDANKMLSDG